jgi:hypothetical protein
MVREVVLRGLPETWVLADNLASSGSHAEMALSISASVSLRLLRTGHTVNLVWLARRQDGDGGGVIGESSQARFEPAGGPARLLETFAQIQLTPTGGTPDEQLSQRILAQISPQGAVAPVYGALASADGQIMTELGHLAPVATPGRLWLTGPGDLASGASAALRRQGWQVSVGA